MKIRHSFYISLLFIFHYTLALHDENPSTRSGYNVGTNKKKSIRNGNVRYNAESGVALSMYNINYITKGESPEERAYDFLENYRKTLNMAQNKEDENFKIISKQKMGPWTTIRLAQLFKGVPVYNSSIAITMNDHNIVRMVTSTYTKGVFLDRDVKNPRQTELSIRSLTIEKYAKGDFDRVISLGSKMVIYQVGKGDCRLAWKTNLAMNNDDDFLELETVFDDLTGLVIHEVDKTLDKKGKRSKNVLYNTGKEINAINKKLRATASKKKEKNVNGDQRLLQQDDFNWFKSAASIFNIVKCDDSTQSSVPTMMPSSVPTMMPSSSSQPSSVPSTSPSLSVEPSTNPTVMSSANPSNVPTLPPINDNETLGYIFDPDPITTANATYCDVGFCDNNDASSQQLFEQMKLLELRNLTIINETYYLKGPYVEIIDVNAPFHGTFEQKSNDFRFSRSDPAFEAVNCYFHVDKFMRYLNDELDLSFASDPDGGIVTLDPHASLKDNSFYSSLTGSLYFGVGGVDDGEDAGVIIHELGHLLHDRITKKQLSQVDGLSEGFGDYLAASYVRSMQLSEKTDPGYHQVLKWDGHNEFWAGRVTNITDKYPEGLDADGSIHQDGQIWSSVNMEIYDSIGRIQSDKAHITGISATNQESNQEDAANAIFLAAQDLGYNDSSIGDIYRSRGYYIPTGYCGDGKVNDFEECDGDAGNGTCATVGCSGGTPTCDSNCRWQYTSCLPDASNLIMKLELTFDQFPQETRWEITSDGVVTHRGGYDQEYDHMVEQTLSFARCFDRSQCHKFIIRDVLGDGICCTFGDGGYSITVDNVQINNSSLSDSFFFERVYTFSSECTS